MRSVYRRAPFRISANVLAHLKRESGLAFAFLSFVFLASMSQAAVRINAQLVVDDALAKGRSAQLQDLNAQRSYLGLAQALGVYDLQFSLIPGYEYNKGDNLTETANLLDRTLTLQAVLSKKFSTGTTLSLEYDGTRQSSILGQMSILSGIPATADLDMVTVGFRQNLLRDFFGYADRLQVEIAQDTIDAALLSRDKNLENVALSAMTLFWNAYVAEQSLKENIEARQKYKELVANVRRKQGFSLTSAGELPRLLAEYTATDQRVKSSSSDYLNAIDALLTAMQVKTTDPVELDVPDTIPPVPQLAPKDVESLRLVRVAKMQQADAEKTVSSVKNSILPQVDFVARAASTGAAQDPSRSYAQLVSGTQPTYYVGFEVKTAIDSYFLRAQVADAVVALGQAQNGLDTQRDALRDQLAALQRTIASDFEVANMSIDVVKQREHVVHDMEIAYRQGRQPLVELIRSYDDLFAAQLARANAIGAYHIALNQLAAARDELVPSVTRLAGRSEK